MNLSQSPVLSIQNLHTHFHAREGLVKALNGVDLSLKTDTVLGLVGETGSGKSVLALSILRLIPYPGEITEGSVFFEGRNLMRLTEDEMLTIRGHDVAMIFQDARGSLNPIERIGDQISEAFRAHSMMSINQAVDRTVDLLKELDLPTTIFNQYPHQISGGMAQRSMIAMAMAWKPRLLIADEPTSNLDMTVQADVLVRLQGLISENHSSLILISHNMGIIAQMADEVAVMYAGSVVEHTTTSEIFERPLHPYSWALLQSIPRLDKPLEPLKPIRGSSPSPIDLPDHCAFISRCPKATNYCRLSPRPPLEEKTPGHFVACYNEIEYS